MSRPRPNPTIAHVRCTKIHFNAGDRILVKVYRTLTKQEADRLEKTIRTWAGAEVAVLIINGLEADLEFQRASPYTLGSP